MHWDDFYIFMAICVLSLFLLFAIPFNCVRSSGKNRRIVHFGNIFLFLSVIGILVSGLISRPGRDPDTYDIMQLNCYKADDGYYIIYRTPPVTDLPAVAVPAELVENGEYLKFDNDIFVYLRKGKTPDSGDTYITDGDFEYVVSDTVIKVVPVYNRLRIYVFFCVWAAQFVFNAAEFFIVLYSGTRRKKKEYFNDFV